MIVSSRHPRDWSTTMTILAVVAGATAVGIAIGLGLITWVLLAAGGLVATLAIFRWPAIGAAFILALAPLEGAITVAGGSVVRLMTLGCVGLIAVRFLVLRKGIEIDRTTWWTVIFMGWAFITILWTFDQKSALSDWISVILQSTMYIVLLNLVSSMQDLKLALWGHVLGGVVLSLLLTQTLVASEFDRRLEIAGLGLNLAARMVGLNLLLSMLLSQLEKHPIAKLVLRGSAIVSGIAVVVSLSRGAWYGVVLSIAAGVAIFALRGKRIFNIRQLLTWIIAGGIALYILGSFVFSQHGLDKLGARFESSLTLSDSASHRFEIWDIGLDMFFDAPIVGHGFGAFPREFTRYLAEAGLPDSFNSGDGKQPHNAFVLVFTEFGLIGFLILLALLTSVFEKVWRLRQRDQSFTPAMAWGAILIVYLISTSMVDTAIERKYFWYILCLITLLVRYWRTVQPIGPRDSLPAVIKARSEGRIQTLQRGGARRGNNE